MVNLSKFHQSSFNSGTKWTDPNRRKAPRRKYPCALGGRQAISLRCYLCRSSAPSRIENGSVTNPGTVAEDAEELKTAKYVCLTDKGYIFQPLAFEIQGGVVPSTYTFVKNLCKELCVFNQEKSRVVFQAETLSRNACRQCGQCSWNGDFP